MAPRSYFMYVSIISSVMLFNMVIIILLFCRDALLLCSSIVSMGDVVSNEKTDLLYFI